MPATLTEVARTAKVSTALVSRLVNRDPTLRITKATRRRIEDAGRKLGGIKVNRAGRTLSTSIAYHVVLPVNRILLGREFGETGRVFLRNFERSLRSADFHFSINYFDQTDSVEFFRDIMESPGYCDGLVLLNGVADAAIADLIREHGYPHVSHDPNAEQLNLNTVVADTPAGCREVVAYLRKLGHTRIGFLGQEKARMFTLFTEGMFAHGLRVQEGWNCRIPSPEGPLYLPRELEAIVGQAFGSWLASRPATALMCQNDAVALAAVEVMRRRELVPGRDLSLVGYDNIEERGERTVAEPVLTTLDHPSNVLGQRCAEVLLNQVLHKQRQIVHEHVDTRLIVRSSTGPCSEPGRGS